jgi:hypothetical protein
VLTGGVAVTDEVWSLLAEALPAAFVPVTATRIVEAGEVTSTCWTTYVDAVAPAMSAQFAPAASQRRHW